MKPDDIMPLICLRCKKDIPLTVRTMEEISYTHYSYCEDCLREGLRLLKAKDKEKEMPIKPVDEIPQTLAEKRQSYRERIRQDICYAITNHISTFEFEGDYNWKYLANYAREEADWIFRRRIYRDCGIRVKNELKEKLHKEYIFPESEFRYKNRYIRIREKKGEDRIHVYGQIDFDFGENFYEILLADTERKYKEIAEREAERNAKKNNQG